METLLEGEDKQYFPCPICGEGLPVRESKKGKPYVVCNACGVQLFVRTEPGIRKFETLVADAQAESIWERLKKLESRYRKKCPKCGRAFWVEEKLIATDWFDGELIEYLPRIPLGSIAPERANSRLQVF